MPFYHARVVLRKKTAKRSYEDLHVHDLDRATLDSRILELRDQGEPITIQGRTVDWSEIESLKIGESDVPASEIASMIGAEDRSSAFVVIGGHTPLERVVDRARNVTDELVVGPPGRAAQRAPGLGKAQEPSDPARKRRVMVVLGRDRPANRALFDFLKDLDLRPQEWSELVAATEHGSPYVGDVLDRAMQIVQAVIVFLTPDDVVHLRDELALGASDLAEQYQPRPNVLFEAGLAFGFHPSRTILVEYGDLRGISDLFGRHVVRLDLGVSALEDLAKRLGTAGCQVDTSSSTWRDASRFPVRKSSADHSRGEEGQP